MNAVLRGFLETLQANVGIVPQLGYDRFLPNPLIFINNYTTQWSRDSVVGLSTTEGLEFESR
jgi:hypothetical protein